MAANGIVVLVRAVLNHVASHHASGLKLTLLVLCPVAQPTGNSWRPCTDLCAKPFGMWNRLEHVIDDAIDRDANINQK